MHRDRWLITSALLVMSLLAGCKLALISVYGGQIQSESGRYVCQVGRNCLVEITDTNFSDVFTAVPLSGYEFVKWQSGPGFLCADSTDPVCSVSNLALDGSPAADSIIASDSIFYLLPIFRTITLPDNADIEFLSGREFFINPRLPDSGECRVEFTVNAQGGVENAFLVSSTFERESSNTACVNTVRDWVYSPGRVDGESVSTGGVQVDFEWPPTDRRF